MSDLPPEMPQMQTEVPAPTRPDAEPRKVDGGWIVILPESPTRRNRVFIEGDAPPPAYLLPE